MKIINPRCCRGWEKPRRRRSPALKRSGKVGEMFGRGQLWIQKQNLFRAGLLATAARGLLITSCMTWLNASPARVQLTTDGHKAYLSAVESAFGSEIDYAMLQKIYGHANEGKGAEISYSPAQCMGARKAVISGMPDKAHVSTSHTERQNLSMRMGMRRFTRLTNAFSKKLENLEHNVALYFMHYNFCRIHTTLRVTPAMEAGISDHVWSMEEIVALLP